MKRLFITSVLFLIVKFSPAQFNCYITNDHLVSPTEYVFDVYIESTGPDFLFRTFQGCFTFDSLFVPAAASVTASFDSGSSQLTNYMPQTFSWSGTAPGFQVAANTSVSCSTGTLISTLPLRIGTFRMVITSMHTFQCSPSYPNMVLPGEPSPGLVLKTAVTKWDANDCSVNTNSNITADGTYTQSGTLNFYSMLNNMAPVILSNPVSASVCDVETVSFEITADSIVGIGSPVYYQWYENGFPLVDISTSSGTYSGTNTPMLTIIDAGYPLNGGLYSCMVTQCNTQTSSDAILTVYPNPPVELGSDTSLSTTSLNLDAGPGYAYYSWSTNDTTQTIAVTTTGSYWVSVVDTNGCTGSDTIGVTFTTGLDILNGAALTLYPNPSRNYFFLSGLTTPVRALSAVNALGEVLTLGYVNDIKNMRVNTTGLASGIYDLQVFTDSGVIVKKLVIQ
jgi:hypothetical protein